MACPVTMYSKQFELVGQKDSIFFNLDSILDKKKIHMQDFIPKEKLSYSAARSNIIVFVQVVL